MSVENNPSIQSVRSMVQFVEFINYEAYQAALREIEALKVTILRDQGEIQELKNKLSQISELKEKVKSISQEIVKLEKKVDQFCFENNTI